MEHPAFWPRLKHLDAYDAGATELAFLLGGIGTGNVSLGARGELKDWELFNKPGKGNSFPYTFFALHVREEGSAKRHARVLEGPIQPPHSRSHGYDSAQLAGLPRMQRSLFRAEYPLCAVQLEDDALPVSVCLEAYTPFIPLDDLDSALPVAILRYRVKNRSAVPCFVSVAGSMANMASFDGYGDFHYVKYKSDTVNREVAADGLRGILFEAMPTVDGRPVDNSLCLLSPHANLSLKPAWYAGAWYDGAQDFWDDFSEDGLLTSDLEAVENRGQILFQTRQRIGSLAAWQQLRPGEEALFCFYISWHVPHRALGWGQNGRASVAQSTRNHYSLRFGNALDVARYTHRNLPRLEGSSLDFHRAFFSSSLPREVLDAASANITVLRSTTCFRIEDGSFFGWEGCFDAGGCCDGSCTHVWNYAQTLAHLFPRLEQSVRQNEFLTETDREGRMHFRARTRLEGEPWDFVPAIDGQCGSIVRLAREWRISSEDGLIQQMGEKALLALDFAIRHWDQDCDGLPDSSQHNTYDIEFVGLNPLSCGVFLAALKAGVVIAEQLMQPARAAAYQALFEAASRKADQLLWDGEYYVQRLDDVDSHPYQHGLGCLSDQLFGQFLAHSAGLGYILPQAHVKQALHSIYNYNFRHDLTGHESVQRCFALAGEPGLLLCSWPKGGRPRFPFVYSNEVWTGIEYQVAASLIREGLVEEGLTIVRATRSRHDGIRRNPFNEVECGHHYARSMASWALLPALSGMPPGAEPSQACPCPGIHPEGFQCFHSTGSAWGILHCEQDAEGQKRHRFEVLYRAQLRDERYSSVHF